MAFADHRDLAAAVATAAAATAVVVAAAAVVNLVLYESSDGYKMRYGGIGWGGESDN